MEAPAGDEISTVSEEERQVDAVVERSAGLDMHRDNVVAKVRVPGKDDRRSGTRRRRSGDNRGTDRAA
jgi:chromosome condensin MukBEF MukE localization factor